MTNTDKTVSAADAIKFLECASRNWSKVPRLSDDDIQDVAEELQSFLKSRTQEPAEWQVDAGAEALRKMYHGQNAEDEPFHLMAKTVLRAASIAPPAPECSKEEVSIDRHAYRVAHLPYPDALAPSPIQGEAVAWVGDYLKSDGTHDYFVMLGHGERQMSLHCHKIRGRAEYEAAEINHTLMGTPKPEFEDFELDGEASPHPVTITDVFSAEEAMLIQYRDEHCQGDDPIKKHAWTVADARLSEVRILHRKLLAALSVKPGGRG